MRIGSSLLRRPGRGPQTGPFKFVEMLPLQLRNEVSTKSEKTAGISCIQEMAVMFACMKANEFVESGCSNEITSFQMCYNKEMKRVAELNKLESLGQDAPGATKLTTNQLNRLLQKYPQFNEPRHKVVLR